ncbi:chitinase [Brachionus plicatilis]|uniref:Chitinase n=1 Tax=Brachionus plicatilis TaxID=10195 RepID=A0A3M7T090_BRAPC|nr:chitinase [Brachionus plicatilis]
MKFQKFILSLLVIIISLITSKISCQKCQSSYEPYFDGTCIDRADCVGAIINNKCPNQPNNVKCCIEETNTVPASPSLVSQSQLENILSSKNKRIEVASKVLIAPNANPTCFEKAFFISQLAHESAKFLESEELGSDSYLNNKYDSRTDLGNNQIGDGSKYKGRGYIQLTGRSNYKRAGLAIGIDLENQPELAAFPSVAAKLARWFWLYGTRENLGTFSDGTFYGFSRVTGLINGGLNGLPDRVDLLKKAAKELQCGDIMKGSGEECTINGKQGICLPICTGNFSDDKLCGCNGNTVSGKCAGPTNIKCCDGQCANDMDLTFVLDSSGSIAFSDFQKSLEFTKNIINEIEIGENKSRVGIINFSSSVATVTRLDSTFSKTNLLNSVDSIVKFSRSTYTGEALQAAKALYNTENGARDPAKGVSKVILVVTDGASNGRLRPEEVASSIKSMGITVISIGVGSNLNFNELNGISSPGRTYLIDSFSTVLQSFDEIKQASCLIPAPIPPKTDPIAVGRNKIKYFSYEVADLNSRSLKVLINAILGRVKLFFSFTNQNPNDFQIAETTDVQTSNQETIEKIIRIPKNESNIFQKIVYLGIKGLQDSNSFIIQVNESLIIELENLDNELCDHYLKSGVKCDSVAYIDNIIFSRFCSKSCNDSTEFTNPTTSPSSSTETTTTTTTKSDVCSNFNEALCVYFVQYFDLCELKSFVNAVPFKIYCCKACESKN